MRRQLGCGCKDTCSHERRRITLQEAWAPPSRAQGDASASLHVPTHAGDSGKTDISCISSSADYAMWDRFAVERRKRQETRRRSVSVPSCPIPHPNAQGEIAPPSRTMRLATTSMALLVATAVARRQHRQAGMPGRLGRLPMRGTTRDWRPHGASLCRPFMKATWCSAART